MLMTDPDLSALDAAYLQAYAATVGSTVESLTNFYFNPATPWMVRGLRDHPGYIWFEKGWRAHAQD